MQTEIWKPIEGYEGLYEVSSLGRVKSLGNDKSRKEKILKPGMARGYLKVGLCRNGKMKFFLVHRLVADAFIPNPMGLPEINHKDEVKTNNIVSNIEWCSAKYNANYGTLQERKASALSKAVEASRFSDFRTIELRFDSTMEADRNEYNSSAVSACCRCCYHYEGNNKYKNLYWRYSGLI